MTSQEMTRYEPAPALTAAPIVTNEQIELVRKTVAAQATDAELQLYLYDCQRHGVHPLDKLLHFTKRQGKYTPITSIDLLRSRAADTGELGGIEDPQYDGMVATPNFTASVTVYRFVQGQRCPFTATARWSEYKPSEDFMWRKMPYLMLGKCAEALALRKAFPRQLAGLYAKEEMDQSDNQPANYEPAPRANQLSGEVIDPPPADYTEPPVCECGAIGKKSKFGSGYYCANKAAHGGKYYNIPETRATTDNDDLFPEETDDDLL